MDKRDEPGLTSYRLLIKAYLAELENNKELALNLYQMILEDGTGPLKEALLRILHLEYKNQDSSLGHLALKCLTQLDPRYLAFYAESNRLKGNNVEAINNYVSYLAIFPEDWQSSLKLAELFYQQKIYEGVEILVNQVLEKYPEQKSALELRRKLNDAIAAK